MEAIIGWKMTEHVPFSKVVVNCNVWLEKGSMWRCEKEKGGMIYPIFVKYDLMGSIW